MPIDAVARQEAAKHLGALVSVQERRHEPVLQPDALLEQVVRFGVGAKDRQVDIDQNRLVVRLRWRVVRGDHDEPMHPGYRVRRCAVRRHELTWRYTHRTAISNERIVRVDAQQVAFRVRADRRGGKRIMTLPGVEFVRRFLLHVLPTGIKRVRHYGLLAPGAKRIRLAAVRAALAMPAAHPLAIESAQACMQRVARTDIALCPVCRVGRLRAVEVLVALKRLPDPHARVHADVPRCHRPPATGPPGARA